MKRFITGGIFSVLVMIAPGTVAAFYVEGLMSGMSSTTVQTILEKRGYKVLAVREDGDIVARGMQDAMQTITAEFCTDRLVRVQNDYPPKFRNFVQLVERKRKELGAPAAVKVLPAKADLKADTDAISFVWLDKETTVEIVYKESEHAPQVAVSHSIKQACQ